MWTCSVTIITYLSTQLLCRLPRSQLLTADTNWSVVESSFPNHVIDIKLHSLSLLEFPHQNRDGIMDSYVARYLFQNILSTLSNS